jgi:hypothetical protein
MAPEQQKHSRGRREHHKTWRMQGAPIGFFFWTMNSKKLFTSGPQGDLGLPNVLWQAAPRSSFSHRLTDKAN